MSLAFSSSFFNDTNHSFSVFVNAVNSEEFLVFSEKSHLEMI